MSVKNLATTGVLTALIYLSTLSINIHIFGSTLHIGSISIVMICLIFDRDQAIISTTLGSLIYDLSVGFFLYAPFTVVARFGMAMIINNTKDKGLIKQVLATIIASMFVVFIYFIAFIIFTGDFKTSIVNSSADTIQTIFNVAAVFIALKLKPVVDKYIKYKS